MFCRRRGAPLAGEALTPLPLPCMRACVRSFVIGLVAIGLACAQTAARSAEGGPRRPVLAYEVKGVQAVVVSGRDGSPWLRISAKGLAPHPGYRNARLVPVKTSSMARLLPLRFLIDPPPPGQPDLAWPMVLAEVEAVALVPLHKHRRVRVRGFDRAVVVRIDRTAPTFPAPWGPPPKFQTKDWRPLPARYGYGSSTLAEWISERLLHGR